MSIISPTDAKSVKGRLVITSLYVALMVGGVTMVYPFLVMLTGSVSNPFDYERRSALPRFLWSREDRFMRTLCTYFPPAHRASIRQLRCYFPDLPQEWQTWAQIGDDIKGSDAWARKQLKRLADPTSRAPLEAAARDYHDFVQTWNVRETILAYDQRLVAPFLRERYRTLERFNKAWEVSVDDFFQIVASEWSGEPIDQPTYVPIEDVRYADLLAFRRAYRENRFTPYLGGWDAPAGYLRPAALRFVWEDYAQEEIGKLGDWDMKSAAALPFPVPPSYSVLRISYSVINDGNSHNTQHAIRNTWLRFLKDKFPIRHVEIPVNDTHRQAFRKFLMERFRNLDYLSRLLERPTHSWDDVQLTPTIPSGALAKVWIDFVRTSVPVEEWTVRDTLPEQAFQKFALKRHGSLKAVNDAYGLNLSDIHQLRIPFGEAILVTFANREWVLTFDQTFGNYWATIDYLFHRGKAVQNTVILVVLVLLVTLTVNPLAGYALSRFRLRATEKIIVFCLATMAFPAAVSAIPGFLLLRDLGLLNTFAALVLPGAAHGMTIFLLKGFFDSLPKELYEAATIDGAPEWKIFTRISLPLVKPILAVSLLNAFMHAYNAWEWALIVCQDRKMWTVAVWTYQFYQTLGGQPFTVMAAFVLTSIPVLLVFLFCQKVILRGIILPQMK